ncbi:MAPEG family protein [Rhodopseudomonas palustris]|uniref:MAPEG family protein n=1 Tax=Rhodopseudomonas palustris (strain BisB18) TaxID=316056 RepID=Q212S7_RHOPB
MSVQMVLLPVFMLVALTLAMLLWSGRGSLGARGDTIAATTEPTVDPMQLAVLFYVLIAIGLPLRRIDLVLVMLSWVFVVTRLAHAGVVVSSGAAGLRSPAYLSGALVLLAMWVYFALRILLLI